MTKDRKWYWFIWDDGPSSFFHGIACFAAPVLLAMLAAKATPLLGLIAGVIAALGLNVFYFDREYGIKGEHKLFATGTVPADYWRAKRAGNVVKMKDAEHDYLGAAIGTGAALIVIVFGVFLGL